MLVSGAENRPPTGPCLLSWKAVSWGAWLGGGHRWRRKEFPVRFENKKGQKDQLPTKFLPAFLFKMSGDPHQNPGRPGEQPFIILKKANITIIITHLLGAWNCPKVYKDIKYKTSILTQQLYEVDTVLFLFFILSLSPVWGSNS